MPDRTTVHVHDQLEHLAERLEGHLEQPAIVGTLPSRGHTGALLILPEHAEQLLEQLEDRVCGVHELAQQLEVDPSTVHRWLPLTGFPEPRSMVSGNPGWSLREVRAWRADRRARNAYPQ